MGAKRLTEETKAEVKQLFESGLKLKEIASTLGISMASVSRITTTGGKTTKVTEEQKNEIINLFKSGLSQLQIAQKTNLSTGTISTHLKAVKKKSRVSAKKTTPKPKVKQQVSSKFSNPELRAQIKKLWIEERYTKSKIAETLKMSFNTVAKVIYDLGIENDQVPVKLKPIHPTLGKIKMTVPGIKGVFHVRPEKLESFKKRHGLIAELDKEVSP